MAMGGGMTTLPERTLADLQVDDYYHRMMTACSPRSKALWCARFTAACNERNRLRSAEEIERLEREKGLR